MSDEKQKALRNAPWGKIEKTTGDLHHLAHHCADVAACFETIASLPGVRRRLERAADEELPLEILARLAVLCFLHDAGKLHPGFQAKGWPDGSWRGPQQGHIDAGAAIFAPQGPPDIADHLCLQELCQWGVDEHLLFSVLAHHGRPFAPNGAAERGWSAVSNPTIRYDPAVAAKEIGIALRRWFPTAFSPGARQMPFRPEFQHLLSGFVTLADWLGSDRRFFPFVSKLDLHYMERAREQAGRAVSSIGLDVVQHQSTASERMDFSLVTGFASPNITQTLIDAVSSDEQLVILEAETGSGKTEAAFWRFARLFSAGKVDSLYFALPTRSSAVQLHDRVNRMLSRFLGDQAPEAVLAIPGYLRAGEIEGEALPGWQVRWEDEGSVTDKALEARWAAESTKRYLAAMVAVGTVDQAMLAALQVKHAHLRGSALSRSLLVIDEVHASDSYMTEVQNHLLRLHLGRGGYGMLMSATLGSQARAKWLSTRPPSLGEAREVPYPAVWGGGSEAPLGSAQQEQQKTVAMTSVQTMDPEECARLAIEAAHRGARVLVIRNTVGTAVSTWTAAREAGGDGLLLNVSQGPALHHGRFAAEDRKLLDKAVEVALSAKSHRSAGVIVIGTQTLEQSLDIDADLLITDLCPVDVLLQRVGRLHRHASDNRPEDFKFPVCKVMMPAKGLTPLLRPDFENGLGAWKDRSGVFNGIYRDLSMLELTKRLVDEHRVWSVPAMNRFLVESATHEEGIQALNDELGQEWGEYRNNVIGKEIADMGAARNVFLPIEQPFAEVLFPPNEDSIRTRLGEEGARITFDSPVTGPFGISISGFTMPAHWSHGLDTSKPVRPTVTNGLLSAAIGDTMLTYGRSGLMKGTK